jgi:hypothetical protein
VLLASEVFPRAIYAFTVNVFSSLVGAEGGVTSLLASVVRVTGLLVAALSLASRA